MHLYQLLSALATLCTSGTLAALHTYNFTISSGIRAPDGVQRPVYLINGQHPGPLIDIDEGDEIQVHVQNELDVESTIHWHGLLQKGSPEMDGVPGVTQKPIPPGGNFTYRFQTTEYGFYWYHSHVKTYYSDGIRGPLLIRPAAWRERPFSDLAHCADERDALLEAESQAANIVLNDWYHQLSNQTAQRYRETGAFPFCADSILANGFGQVECLPENLLHAGASLGVRNSSSGPSLSPRGCTPPSMFKSGYNSSSFPPETCTSTSSPRLKLTPGGCSGWMALNLVNAGTATKLTVSLDAHSMYIYAADGLYVDIKKVQVLEMEIGQRYSVMVRLDQVPGDYPLRFATYPSGDMQQVLESSANFSYNAYHYHHSSSSVNNSTLMTSPWMYPNGSAQANATKLDPQTLSPHEKSLSPPQGAADQTLYFRINQTEITSWVIDGSPFAEPSTPILYGAASEAWDANTTYHLPINATIDIIMEIADMSMDHMGHPIHLHGHKFWVLGSGSGGFPYVDVAEGLVTEVKAETGDGSGGLLNLKDPPYRDTTSLPKRGWTVIRYVTDNPGAWIMHCHIQWHLLVGMAVVLVEGQEQMSGILGRNSSLC